jgi:hypothetical protein
VSFEFHQEIERFHFVHVRGEEMARRLPLKNGAKHQLIEEGRSQKKHETMASACHQ